MGNLIRENISTIITVIAFAVGGIVGYTTLRNDVTELQRNRVTVQEMTSAEKDISELKGNITESNIKTVHTTVQDMNREIDTLYLKAELALTQVAALKSELYELRGHYNATRSALEGDLNLCRPAE